jgi:hypothetical protein
VPQQSAACPPAQSGRDNPPKAGESYVDALRPLDHVGIGHDVAVRVHDHSGTDRLLAGYERRLTAIVLFQSPIAGDQNLNHRRRNPGGKLLDRGIELLQHRWRFRRPGSHRLRAVHIRFRRLTAGDGRGLRRHFLTEARRRKPQPAKRHNKSKKRNAKSIFRTTRWEDHGHTLLGKHFYRVKAQTTIMPEEWFLCVSVTAFRRGRLLFT